MHAIDVYMYIIIAASDLHSFSPRELKVRVSKGDMFSSLFLSKKKHPTEPYILTLRKVTHTTPILQAVFSFRVFVIQM